MFHLFQLYVAIVSSLCFKVDPVLHMLQCTLVANGQRPAVATWCCCRDAVVVQVRAPDGCGRPQAWCCCRGAAMIHVRARGRGSRCWRAMRVSGRGARDAMQAGAGAVTKLRPDKHRLQSRIWRGAKGVAHVKHGCESGIRSGR
jgi:hypothetical protein